MSRQSMRTRGERVIDNRRAAVLKDRTAALELMPENLLARFRDIEQADGHMKTENILYYYRLGKTLCEIRDRPGDFLGNDGITPGIELVKKALATQETTIRRSIKFTTEFSQTEAETMARFTNEVSNFRMHWGHINNLLTAPHEHRMALAREAVDQMLDPKELHELIKTRYPRPGEGHGPSPRLPAEVSQQVTQILRQTKAWLKRHVEIWCGDDVSVYENIKELTGNKIDGGLLDQLEDLAEQLGELEVAARDSNVACVKAMEHVQKVLTQTRETPNARGRGQSRRRELHL